MEHINKPLTEGYTFDLGSYFKQGMKLLNAQLGTFVGMTLLFLVIQFVLSYLPVVNLLNNLLGSFLFAGYFIYCRNIINREEEAGDFFKGFNYAGQIFLYLIVYFLLLMPLFAVLFAFVFPFGVFYDLISGNILPEDFGVEFGEHLMSMGPGIFLVFFIVVVGFLYLSISYLFVIPLIVDAQQGFWQAMELSRKTVSKKFFSFLFSIILAAILIGIGAVITCGLGLLFLLPLMYCIIFAAYDQIFQPFTNTLENDIDAFGRAEKDINTEAQENNE